MESRKVESHGKRGLWKPEEDLILRSYVETYGEGNWADISRKSGLKRGGKSCRLRWKNYLRPNIKRGSMSKEEEDLIIRMHKLLGNRWSLIAGRLPGRTDNEVKNYWNTHLNKKCESRKRKATESDGRPSDLDTSTKQQRVSERTTKSIEEEAKQERRGESIVTSTWKEDLDVNGFGYGIGSPFAFSEFAMSAFDDLQPSFGLADLFPLF